MAVPTDATGREREEESFEQRIAPLRATPEQIARLVRDTPPFDFDAWMAEAGSEGWTAEDEAEIVEWLAERETMRRLGTQRLEEKLAGLGE